MQSQPYIQPLKQLLLGILVCFLLLGLNAWGQSQPQQNAVTAQPSHTSKPVPPSVVQPKPTGVNNHSEATLKPEQKTEQKPAAPARIEPPVQEEALNLGQVTKASDKSNSAGGLGQSDFFRVYGGLIFVLGVILMSLWLLRKSPWFQQLKANIGAPVEGGVVNLKKTLESEKQFYQPQIIHRTRLGPGKELLTVYQAGQWLLLGSTANQVNLVAKLDELQTAALPKELAQDAGFQHIYDKYVEPLKQPQPPTSEANRVSTPNLLAVSQEAPEDAVQSVESPLPFRPQFITDENDLPETVVTQHAPSFVDEGYEEEQLKDFEDWYDGPFVSATIANKGRTS